MNKQIKIEFDTLYRIQERKFSSNIIEFSNNDGNTWKPLLSCHLPKKLGDSVIDLMFEQLKYEALGIDEDNLMLYEIDNRRT